MSEQSIWKEINENYNSLKFDYALLEELFSKPKRPISVPFKEAIEMVSYLEAKTSMGLSIFLNKTRKWPMEDLVNLVRCGRSKELTLDNLACLKKVLPEKNEVDEIKAYCRKSPDNESHLAKADRFIKLLSDVPHYELRISLMIFLEEFEDTYARLNAPLLVYDRSARAVLVEESIRELLSMVLRMGNFLNTNSYKGNANAFKITSLGHLQELNANKAGVTALHFLVEQFEANHPADEGYFRILSELKEIGKTLR